MLWGVCGGVVEHPYQGLKYLTELTENREKEEEKNMSKFERNLVLRRPLTVINCTKITRYATV